MELARELILKRYFLLKLLSSAISSRMKMSKKQAWFLFYFIQEYLSKIKQKNEYYLSSIFNKLLQNKKVNFFFFKIKNGYRTIINTSTKTHWSKWWKWNSNVQYHIEDQSLWISLGLKKIEKGLLFKPFLAFISISLKSSI